MTLSLTSKQVVANLKRNIQRVDNRVDNYLNDANENNIHDTRTAIRRIDASFRILPKRMRSQSKIRNTWQQAKNFSK